MCPVCTPQQTSTGTFTVASSVASTKYPSSKATGPWPFCRECHVTVKHMILQPEDVSLGIFLYCCIIRSVLDQWFLSHHSRTQLKNAFILHMGLRLLIHNKFAGLKWFSPITVVYFLWGGLWGMTHWEVPIQPICVLVVSATIQPIRAHPFIWLFMHLSNCSKRQFCPRQICTAPWHEMAMQEIGTKNYSGGDRLVPKIFFRLKDENWGKTN